MPVIHLAIHFCHNAGKLKFYMSRVNVISITMYSRSWSADLNHFMLTQRVWDTWLHKLVPKNQDVCHLVPHGGHYAGSPTSDLMMCWSCSLSRVLWQTSDTIQYSNNKQEISNFHAFYLSLFAPRWLTKNWLKQVINSLIFMSFGSHYLS